jgi:hypothetical protein
MAHFLLFLARFVGCGAILLHAKHGFLSINKLGLSERMRTSVRGGMNDQMGEAVEGLAMFATSPPYFAREFYSLSARTSRIKP